MDRLTSPIAATGQTRTSTRIFWLCCIAFLTACGSGPAQETDRQTSPSDRLTVYEPDTTVQVYADGFRLKWSRSRPDAYRLLRVSKPWQGADTTLNYCLVRRADSLPPSFKTQLAERLDALVIETPCRRLVCTSTTQAPMLSMLGEASAVVGYSQGQYVCDPSIRAGLEEGRIAEVGAEGSLDIEKVVALRPDLLLGFSLSAENAAYDKLRELGVPVVLFSEWTEPHPLGRAAWLCFLGQFFEKDEAARRAFEGISRRYEAVAERSRKRPEKPTVFKAAPFSGTWYMAGGDTYAARLVEDAGGDYLWADEGGNQTLSLDFEAVYDRAANADIWLQPGQFGSLQEMRAADERFAEFSAFQGGQVWNSDKRLNQAGGSEYWELGVARPDLVLKDLSLVFQGDPEPDSLYFFRKLP